MSNYLNNIVARSLNLTDVVQPRLPQPFEQASPVVPAVNEPAVLYEDIASEPKTPPQRVHHHSEAISENSQSSPTITTVQSQPQLVLEDRELSTAPVGREFDKPTSTERIEPPVIKPDSLAPQPDHAQQSSQHLQKITREAAEIVTPRHSRRQAYREVKQDLVSQPGTATPLTSSTSLVGPSRAEVSLRSEEKQSPTIKITIGRVDVRAIMPETPRQPQPAPRPKPKLSLDDYLRQREEGKR